MSDETRLTPDGKYASLDDRTTWPSGYDNPGWVLRYGQPDRRTHLLAASYVSAYMALVDPGLSQKDALAGLRRARRARLAGYGREIAEAAG